MSVWPEPKPKSVGELIREAALYGLDAVAQQAHREGNFALRDALAARWLAAVSIGVGSYRGLTALRHTP